MNFALRLEAFCSRRRFGIVVLVATALMAVVLGIQGCPLRNHVAAPLGIVSLELAGDAERAQAIIDSWKDLRSTAMVQVILDFPFIIFYSFALFFFGLLARQRRVRADNLPELAIAARIAAWGGLAAGIFDCLEDLGLLMMLGGTIGDAIAARTSLCAIIKFTLITTAIGISTVAALARPVGGRPPLSWGSMARIARATVGILLVTGLALVVPPETRDMLAGLSRHGLRGIWSSFAFNFALWVLAVSAWYWSRAVLSARFDARDTEDGRLAAAQLHGGPNADPAPLNWVPRLLFAAAAAIGVIAALRSGAWWQLAIILAWAVPMLLLLYYRLQLPPRYWWLNLSDAQAPVRAWLVRLPLGERIKSLLSYAPLGPHFSVALLAFAGLVFLVGAAGTFFPNAGWGWLVYWIGWALPGPAAAILFLGLIIGPLTVLTYAGDRVCLGGRLWHVEWTIRPPLFLFLLAIILAVPSLVALHAVRVASANAHAVGSRNSLDELFAAWSKGCAKPVLDQKGDNKTVRPVPVRPVIVALSGGASRAGLWGARVLLEADIAAQTGGTGIFAVSSVSGGSLGAAAYAATLAGQAATSACALDDGNRELFKAAVIAALGDDALGPALAGALFGDVPRALFGIPAYIARGAGDAIRGVANEDMRGGDRAEALERAFERNWSGATRVSFGRQWTAEQRNAARFSRPFLGLAYKPGQVGADGRAAPRGGPIWIANGTDAQNGERVLTAPFNDDAWPFLGALDALALLRRDVPVSTAIHNTGRFAFLSPAGELSPVRDDKVQPASGPKRRTYPTQLIDGGYFENEGLLTAWELARYLQDNGRRILGDGYVVEPILVQATADADPDIEEDRIIRCGSESRGVGVGAPSPAERPTESLGKSRPFQAAIPLLGLYNVRGGHSDWVLREVRRQYCSPNKQQFYHYYLYRTDEDVPLNWVLSHEMSCQIWKAMSQDVKGMENPNLAESRSLANLLQPPTDQKQPGQGAASRSPDNCPSQ